MLVYTKIYTFTCVTPHARSPTFPTTVSQYSHIPHRKHIINPSVNFPPYLLQFHVFVMSYLVDEPFTVYCLMCMLSPES